LGRQKQKRFVESETKPNIIQPGKSEFGKLKGQWAPSFFKNSNNIVLELGCGRGEYTIGLSRLNRNVNHVGVDIKGYRIWVGAEKAEQEKLLNAAFLRTEIENIDMHFGASELSEIWLPFPDQRPKGRDEKRRLTSPRFLELYKKLLKPNGVLRLKTDNRPLFDYTLEVLQQTPHIDLVHTFDLYNSPLLAEHYGIQTNFESKYLAKNQPIHYLGFSFL
jgi:tRNA (guanine-N7-)-methyltransferase